MATEAQQTYGKASTSQIKGGGRAALSSESENAIVDLLMSLRDESNPLLPRRRESQDGNDDGPEKKKQPSDHEFRRRRKKFVKRLVECHEKQERTRRRADMMLRLNNQRCEGEEGGENEDEGIDDAAAAAAAVASKVAVAAGGDVKMEEDEVAVEGKVRVELVEAVYTSSDKKSSSKKKSSSSDGKKKSSSSKSSSSKSKVSSSSLQSKSWKDGPTRKALVLPRSTTIQDVFRQSKSKLRMKKVPNRCFVVDKANKMELDLKNDLRGLEDGTVLYVTLEVASDETKKKDGKKKKATDEGDNDPNQSKHGAAEEEEDKKMAANVELPDPIESVKRAYAERRRQKRQRHHPSQGQHPRIDSKSGTVTSPLSAANFAPHLEKLPTLSTQRATLPASSYRLPLLQTLDTQRVVIICGATGCGKSTQIPQYILEGMIASNQLASANILVTQPRRVAAMSLAERVSQERDSPPPGKRDSVVGYNVRLSRAVAETAKIVYCTVGILLRMLVNPTNGVEDVLGAKADDDEGGIGEPTSKPKMVPLSDLTHVIIDEVHERDVNTDFVLTLLRRVLKVNSQIRVILMSATASADLFVNYFCSDELNIEPKVLSIPGKTYPVSTMWLDDCEKFSGSRMRGGSSKDHDADRSGSDESGGLSLSPRATDKIDDGFICRLVMAIVREQQKQFKKSSPPPTLPSSSSSKEESHRKEGGAILIFLPGKMEIESLSRTLRNFTDNSNIYNILILHSSIPPAQQRLVFRPANSNTTKIILATNVAETSITIPDVTTVIDTGLVKELRFNSETGIGELVTVWTSRASATQRSGRAGRTSPGRCYRLYSQDFAMKSMVERTTPEIIRTPLDELVLQVCLLEEQMRDDNRMGTGDNGSTAGRAVVQDSNLQSMMGTSPVQFLSQAPEPPPTSSLLHACRHLLDVGALTVLATEPNLLVRLTPLGYHLAHLPMDAKVGKVLIVGCILECVDPALTIAAALSSSKTCWFPSVPNHPDGKRRAREVQGQVVEGGFGGLGWKGGTVKADLVAVIAAYNAWMASASLSSGEGDKNAERRQFAVEHALDHNQLREMERLRVQFQDSLIDGGFLESRTKSNGMANTVSSSRALASSNDDALLVSCCLVAGLYPNVATLLRPTRGKGSLRRVGGRLVTKDGDVCKPSSSSFQVDRIRNASESGRDAYAVFHGKHRSLGVVTSSGGGGRNDERHIRNQPYESYLSEVNFVSRFALLLFSGGTIDVRDDNAIVLDGWLKFKVGDNGRVGAVLIQELRKELDAVILKHMIGRTDEETNANKVLEEECRHVMRVVRRLLSEE